MTGRPGRSGLAWLFGADSRFAQDPLGLLAGASIVLIWAGWYVVSRWGVLGSMTPADITLVRYLTGTVLTLPMLWWWRGRKVPWRVLPVVVLSYGFPYAMAIFLGLRSSPAANAGVLLNGLLPVASAAMAWAVMGQNVGRGKWLAIAVLFASNLLMLQAGLRGGSLSADVLWIVAATASLAVFMTAVRKWPVDTVVLVPAMSVGNLVLFLPLWPFMERNLAGASALEISVQAVFQGAVNQVLVIWLVAFAIRRIGSVSTSVLYGFVPVATALFGWALLGEGLSPAEGVAILGVTAGIVAFARSR